VVLARLAEQRLHVQKVVLGRVPERKRRSGDERPAAPFEPRLPGPVQRPAGAALERLEPQRKIAPADVAALGRRGLVGSPVQAAPIRRSSSAIR
jgi:hypothetical protein